MSYVPRQQAESLGFATTTPLGIGGSYVSTLIDANNWSQVQTEVLADQDGTMLFEFHSDAGGTDVVRSLTVPYTAADGYQLFAAPAFTNYIKYTFTNTSGVAQTDFYFTTKLLSTALSPQTLRADGFISPAMMTNLNRSVIVGSNSNGSYTNLSANGVDSNNSTSTPLGISGVFTGAWSDVTGFAEIRVSYDADQPGTDCRLEFSPDGAIVERSIPVPPQANTLQTNFGAVHTLNPILPYFRVVYTNGSVAQTAFNLTTIFATTTGNGLISRSTQVLNRYNDVQLSRLINSPEQDRNFGLIGYERAERKFGVNEAVSNGAYEDIWAEGGLYTLLQTADTVRVKAGGNAADTAAGIGARIITVEGLDENWNEASEDITLAGTLVSASTTTTFIRINRVFVKTCGTYGGSNTGIIRIEDTSATTILAHIPAGNGITFQAIYAVPAGKTAYITEIKTSVGESNSADVRMWNVEAGDLTFPVKKYESAVEDFSGYQPDKLETYLKFQEKETLGFDAIRITGSGSARISVEFDFILVDNA
jgi:hypothetical protein